MFCFNELSSCICFKGGAAFFVVVVGYGSVDKKELTSAVTAVSSKDFLQGAFTSPLSMIDGKVSGVNVSNAAAADPNSSPNIQMRGASSIEFLEGKELPGVMAADNK